MALLLKNRKPFRNPLNDREAEYFLIGGVQKEECSSIFLMGYSDNDSADYNYNFRQNIFGNQEVPGSKEDGSLLYVVGHGFPLREHTTTPRINSTAGEESKIDRGRLRQNKTPRDKNRSKSRSQDKLFSLVLSKKQMEDNSDKNRSKWLSQDKFFGLVLSKQQMEDSSLAEQQRKKFEQIATNERVNSRSPSTNKTINRTPK